MDKFDSYKNYKKNLIGAYKETFEKIESYIDITTKLTTSEKNNCLNQILDSFLICQEENKPLIAITGNNLKNYCDSMIYGEAIYAYKAFKIALTFLSGILYVLLWLVLNNGLNKLGDFNNFKFQSFNLGLGHLILFLGAIISPKIVETITQKYFENPKIFKKIKSIVDYTSILIFFTICFIINEIFKSYLITISINTLFLIFLYTLLIAIAANLIMRVMQKQEKTDCTFLLNRKYEKYLKR